MSGSGSRWPSRLRLRHRFRSLGLVLVGVRKSIDCDRVGLIGTSSFREILRRNAVVNSSLVGCSTQSLLTTHSFSPSSSTLAATAAAMTFSISSSSKNFSSAS